MAVTRLIDSIQVKLYNTLINQWMSGVFGGRLASDKLLPMAIALEEVAHHLRRLDVESGGVVTYVELEKGIVQ